MHRRLVLLFAVAVTMAAPAASAAEISIGFANPLTGPYATSGGRNRIAWSWRSKTSTAGVGSSAAPCG